MLALASEEGSRPPGYLAIGAARELQGHSGTLMECKACHTSQPPSVSMNGPHGMHNVADMRFVDHEHEDFFENNEASCRACHGANLRGSVLSKTSKARSFFIEDHWIQIPANTPVACNVCHSMPD